MFSSTTSDKSSGYRGGDAVTAKLERHEVFETSGPGTVRVTTASGDVTIGASESNVMRSPSASRILRSNACSTRPSSNSTGKRIRWSFGLERMRTSTHAWL